MSQSDVLCAQILKGLIKLDEYLDEPIARDALELDKNSSTTNSKELLKRLKISMSQYSERGRNLVYVGFMGHFSTGKSSAINSILRLKKGSKEYRSIGLNPVDKSITLITHDKNKDSIINVTREGLVPIRSNIMENDFLENIVIADTSGTGDPVLVGEIAKDFLPICDLILYFFSATNSLDTSDEPLLKEKFSQLSFIPTKFVVTRADEFKKDRDTALCKGNFEESEANAFVETLTQRINQLFQYEGTSISSDDIFLVDNQADFNIDTLRSYIDSFSDKEDISGQFNIHSHKIRYFQSSANALKLFFSNFLSDKVTALTDFVCIANKNIDQFNGAIQITNNSLTEFWTEAFKTIQIERESAIKGLPEKSKIPEAVDGYRSIDDVNKLIYLNITIDKEVQRKMTELIQKGKSEASIDIKSALSDLKNRINSARIDSIRKNADFVHLKASVNNLQEYFRNKPVFESSASLTSSSSKVINNSKDEFWKSCEQLGKDIDTLKRSLSEQKPLTECEATLVNAEDRLASDFDKFFDIITIYRSGVFSYNVKETINKLGLGAKLDKLEANNFSDIEKESIKQDAKEEIFPDRVKILNSFKQNYIQLELKCSKLEEDFERFRKDARYKKKLPNAIQWQKEEFDPIIKDLEREIESDIDNFQQKVNISLQSQINLALESWNKSLLDVSRQRQSYFTSSILSFSSTGLFVYILWVYFRNTNVSSDLFNVLAVGLLTNGIFSLSGFIFAKLRDNFPHKIQLSESQILERFRENSFSVLETEYDNFMGVRVVGTADELNLVSKDEDRIERISVFLSDYWKSNLIDKPTEEWKSHIEDSHFRLFQLGSRYSSIIEEYHELIENVEKFCSEYFSDTHSNLEKLRNFSKRLKKKAVDPSFNLLSSTRDTLESVQKKIKEIGFV